MKWDNPNRKVTFRIPEKVFHTTLGELMDMHEKAPWNSGSTFDFIQECFDEWVQEYTEELMGASIEKAEDLCAAAEFTSKIR